MKKRSGLKRTGSMIVFGLISVVIFLWTAYLTTSFLGMVLPASFWVVPYLGLVVFDGGMIGWMFVYLYLAEGSMQRSISLGLTVFNLLGVGLMTIAEIVLGGQTLTDVPEMLGTVAIWAVGIWTFVNVAGIVAFHLSSPDAKIAAAIQEEKDAVVEEALTDLSNRRHENAKLLSSQLGAGMFKTLVSELGADVDDDDLPDVAERPSNRGRGAPRRDTMPSPPARPYQSGDTIKLPSDFGSWSPEDKMAFISAGGVAGWAGGNSNGHGPDGDTRPTQRPDGR